MFKKIVVLFSLTFFIFSIRPVVAAEASKTETLLIFNQISYTAGDTVELTINISNFYDLYKVTLEIEVPDILEIIKVNNGYVEDETPNQIFSIQDSEVALEYYNEANHLLFYIITKVDNSNEGYQDMLTTFNNRLLKVSFKALVEIENIYEVFYPSDDFDEKINMFLVLENTKRKNIPYQVKYYESLKYAWNEQYTYDVGFPIHNSSELLEDIVILNRDIKDIYIGLDFRQVNTNQIGQQIIILIIKDFKTKDIIFDVKYIEIIDRVSPEISGVKLIQIDDHKLQDAKLDDYLHISDNYCEYHELDIKYSYYTPDNIVISNEDIKSYLASNQVAFLKVEVTDTSNNRAEPFIREIRINDLTPPLVSVLDSIVLENEEVESFVLEDLISIRDNYDSSPKLILSFYDLNGQAIDGYEEHLRMGKGVIVNYFGQDQSYNKTPVYTLKIDVVDTIRPTVSAAEELCLFDTSIESFDPLEGVTFYDNFGIEDLPLMTFYRDDKGTLIDGLDNFKEYLSKGNVGYIKFVIIDNAGNVSEPIFQKIVPLDVTRPIIKVLNVASNQLYSKLERIEYIVTDNFDGKVDVVLTLNGKSYDGMPITQNGKYQLVIVASDKAGNESQVVIDFEISSKALFNGDGPIINFINNNFEMIIGGAVLVILSIYIIVYFTRKKKIVKGS